MAILIGWVQRIEPTAPDIQQLNGVAKQVGNTCWQCVALNRTVFKDNNKPLYTHPHCECVQIAYKFKGAILIFDESKVSGYLFVDKEKNRMMKKMGYRIEDAKSLYALLYKITKTYFEEGDYHLNTLNIYGQHFQINFLLSGKRDHIGEQFKCHIGCIAYPNAQIKIATPLIKERD